ncbi:MAG: endolytic transglycosylase MltG [Caldilineaceae bacterium]
MSKIWCSVAVGLVLLALTACGDTMQRVYLQGRTKQVNQAVSTDSRPVRFVVESGTPARMIGQNLASAGLITDARLFEAYVRVNGLAAQLEAGTFILSPAMTMAEIVASLQEAEAAAVTITIPEGWRLEQIGDYLAAAEVFSDTTELAIYRSQTVAGTLTTLESDDYAFLNSRPPGASLEGYLFPDTYELPATAATAEDLLRRQLETFALRVVPRYEDALHTAATVLTLHEVVTLASIVEREAVIAAERPAIARVYLNRLTNNMRLEADPTVQYAMGYQAATDQWWKTPVFLDEYSSVDSPYNTYLYPGLPPGPIASPGLSSIEAVLHPDDHNYLYFVALPDGSGGHVFSETFEEHSENVRKYLGR